MTLLQTPEEGNALEDDQGEVFDQYHTGTGRVCVDAGAGTGKTKTLIDTVAEAVLQGVEQGDENPLDDILVTTFTKDAAAELKTKLKQRLREHESELDGQLPTDVWRWIETESHIETIDSFTHDLLREIAVEANIPPSFDIRDGLEEEDLYDEIMETLESDEELEDAIERLTDAYPNQDYLPYPPADLRELLTEVHEKRREFCWSQEETRQRLERAVTHQMHQGREPPFDSDDVREILVELTGETRFPDGELVDHINAVYDHNLQLARDFGAVLQRFEEEYEEHLREEGLLSYTDVTYYVWKFLQTEEGNEWADSLRQRYEHVFIDEFQDTSYAQCRILSRFLRDESDPNNLLIIGDVKQSIYQWRSAEPRIFAEIINHARSAPEEADDFLEATNLRYQVLTSNFRSHPQLVSAANHVFDDVFSDEARGAIGFEVPFSALEPQRPETEPEDPHLHVLDLGEDYSQDREAERFAQSISGILEDGQVQVVDTEDSNPIDDPELRDPIAGDIALLFRRRTHLQTYAEQLEEYGVATAIDVSSGLFAEPEIQLVIDILDWFAHPHSKDSLVRIVRSPVTALSDETLRFLASKKFYLSWALREWPDGLPDEDKDRLEGLVGLRDDLRWDREAQKSTLIEKVLRHTAFDAIVLSDIDGKQKYGNLWQFVEVVNQWEEEELLSYREFVERLHRLRDRAQDGDAEYSVAEIADEDSDETVRLTTIYKSKGLEYPIVFLPDLEVKGLFGQPFQSRYFLSRQHGMALHPVTGDQDSFDLDAGPGGSWISDNGTGPIWVSGSRNSQGQLRYDTELNQHLVDSISEHWRVLYVAFTRAADHLFLGLSDEVPHGGQHGAWSVTLRDLLAPDNGWGQEDGTVSLAWQDDTGIETTSIELGIDDIRPGVRSSPDPIGIEVVESTMETYDGSPEEPQPSFLPRSVTPTSLHDLLECPLRFQYRMLQDVSELRADTPPGADPPGNLERNTWGTLVHQALEHRHSRTGDLEAFLSSERDSVAAEIRNEVVPNYEATETGRRIQVGATEILPEHGLNGYLETEDGELYVRGKIDLLFEDDEGWHLVDFKTGSVAAEGTYLHESYRYQLLAYAWLLQSQYGIEPASARLVYVHPSVHETEIEIDLDDFTEPLQSLPGTIELVGDQGLPARPAPEDVDESELEVNSRCGSCPYRDLCPEW